MSGQCTGGIRAAASSSAATLATTECRLAFIRHARLCFRVSRGFSAALKQAVAKAACSFEVKITSSGSAALALPSRPRRGRSHLSCRYGRSSGWCAIALQKRSRSPPLQFWKRRHHLKINRTLPKALARLRLRVCQALLGDLFPFQIRRRRSAVFLFSKAN